MREIEIYQEKFYIQDWMIREDGSLILHEKKLAQYKEVKIVIKPNEDSSHNIPHIHAYYADKEYSIAIDDSYKLLAPSKEDKYYKFIKRTMFNDELIQIYRKAWNEDTNSLLKFDVQDDIYLSTYSSANK